MKYFRKLGLMALLCLSIAPAYAAMAPTAQSSVEPERALIASNLAQRNHVRQQLIELGVDAAEATERVSRMTDQQVSALQGKITELPAGAGVSTTNLLLIIILVILII